MLVTLLVRSFERSIFGRILKKLNASSLVRKSLTYRSLKLLYGLSSASTESAFMKVLRRICAAARMLSLAILSLTPKIRSPRIIGKYVDRLVKILLSPWMLPIGLLLFFWSSAVRVSILTLALIYLAALIMASGISLAYKEEDLRIVDLRHLTLFLGTVMFILGYAAFIIQISNVRGLPLLNEELRRGLSPVLNYLAWTTVPGTAFLLSSLELKRCQAYTLTLVGFIPSFFLAFRTEIIAFILMATVVLYFRGIIDYRHVIFGLILATAFSLGIGAVRSITTGLAQDPLLSVLYRPTITIAALDTIVRLYALKPITHGWVHLAALSSLKLIGGSIYGPRTLISIYVGGRRTVSTTATLIGGPLLDWGIWGVIFTSFLYSYLLAVAYRFSRKSDFLIGPYSVIFSYLIVGIETGILDLNVYIYLLLSVIIVLISLRPKNEAEI